MEYIVYFFTTILLISAVYGYEDYAPASMCAFGYPRHDNHLAQTSQCPVSITTNVSTFGYLDAVKVTVSGSAMKGIVLRSRSDINDWVEPHGEFREIPSKTRAVGMFAIDNACVTHSGELSASQLEFVWVANIISYPSTIYFVATIVQDFETFWINCTSPLLTYSGTPNNWPYGKPEQAREMATAFDDSVCGTSMTCMRYPNKCTKGKDCQAIVAYKNNGSYTAGPPGQVYAILFEMWVANADYIALGFSSDFYMSDADGGDVVLFCGERDGRRTVQAGWNGDDRFYQIHRLENFIELEARRDGNEVSCRMIVYTPFGVYLRNDKTGAQTLRQNVDYWDSDYYLFMGFGELYPDAPQPMKHQRLPLVTDKKYRLSRDTEFVFTALNPMIKAHAGLTSFGWLWMVACGLILARHRRVTGDKKCLNKGLWFQMHQVLVLTGIIISIPGIILAFVFRKGWSTFATPHAVLGILVTVFAVAQIIIGYTRPEQDSPNRRLFLWAHRVLAILCILFAFVGCMVSVTMKALPPALNVGGSVTLVVWLLVVLGIEIFLEVNEYRNRNNAERESPRSGDTDKSLGVADGHTREECGGGTAASVCYIVLLIASFVVVLALVSLVAIM